MQNMYACVCIKVYAHTDTCIRALDWSKFAWEIFFRSMRHVDRTVHFDLKTQFDNFFVKNISRSRSQVSKLYMGMVHTTITLV